jgi:opacity protein-like surface antigen
VKTVSRRLLAVWVVAAAASACAAQAQQMPVLPRKPTTAPPASDQLFQASRWRLDYDAGEGARSFEVGLHPGGLMTNTDPNDRTSDNDGWEAQGRYLLLRFNHSYAVYTGVLGSDGRLQGHAVNQQGESWPWTASRVPQPNTSR